MTQWHWVNVICTHMHCSFNCSCVKMKKGFYIGRVHLKTWLLRELSSGKNRFCN